MFTHQSFTEGQFKLVCSSTGFLLQLQGRNAKKQQFESLEILKHRIYGNYLCTVLTPWASLCIHILHIYLRKGALKFCVWAFHVKGFGLEGPYLICNLSRICRPSGIRPCWTRSTWHSSRFDLMPECKNLTYMIDMYRVLLQIEPIWCCWLLLEAAAPPQCL